MKTATETIGIMVQGTNGFSAIHPDYLHLFKPHRDPMILLDLVQEVDLAKKRLKGTKFVRATDPYVRAQFPHDPVMPASFLVEAMAQASGCLMNLIYMSQRNVNFETLTVGDFRNTEQPPFNVLAESKVKQLNFAVPGDELTIDTRLLLQRKEVYAFQASCAVGKRLVAQGDMILAFPGYTPNGVPESMREINHAAR